MDRMQEHKRASRYWNRTKIKPGHPRYAQDLHTARERHQDPVVHQFRLELQLILLPPHHFSHKKNVAKNDERQDNSKKYAKSKKSRRLEVVLSHQHKSNCPARRPNLTTGFPVLGGDII
jgi:hypothetical protein